MSVWVSNMDSALLHSYIHMVQTTKETRGELLLQVISYKLERKCFQLIIDCNDDYVLAVSRLVLMLLAKKPTDITRVERK